MANYDVTRLIDYVLEHSHQPQLDYIGFSMGSTAFFAALSLHPEYNEKVRRMVALAPCTYMYRSSSPIGILKYIPDNILLTPYEVLYKGEFRDLQNSMKQILERMNGNIDPGFLYKTIVNLVFRNSQQTNKRIIQRVTGHSPSSVSARTLLHFRQLLLKPYFRKFDYGFLGNMGIYGRTSPPEYHLHRVSAPVFALYGREDKLCTPPDVLQGLRGLGHCVNIKSAAVEDPGWSHVDFLYGIDAKKLVYDELLAFLQSNLTHYD